MGDEHSQTAEALVAEVVSGLATTGGGWQDAQLRARPEVQALLDAPPPVRAAALGLVLEARLAVATDRSENRKWQVEALYAVLARRKLILDGDAAETQLRLMNEIVAARGNAWTTTKTMKAIVASLEASAPTWSQDDIDRLAPLAEPLVNRMYDDHVSARVRVLLWPPPQGPTFDGLEDGDDVGPRLRTVLSASPEPIEALGVVADLLASFPKAGRASKRWLADADQATRALTRPAELARSLLSAILDAGDTSREHRSSGRSDSERRPWISMSFLTPRNETAALGVVAFCSRVGDGSFAEPLRRLAAKAVRIPPGGDLQADIPKPRSMKLANACVAAIAEIGGPEALTELLALDRATTNLAHRKLITKAIDALASAEGMTRDELLERAVPSHGLQPDGTKHVELTRGHARVAVDARSVALTFVDESGRVRKSFPADVRTANAERLDAIRDELKAIRKTIAAERTRLDGLLANARTWDLVTWQTYYAGHPITGSMARGLVWSFAGQDGEAVTGLPESCVNVRDREGHAAAIPAGARVTLWHPAAADAATVFAWRLRLLTDLVVQPIRQVFRETYAADPSLDGASSDYSNRFAAHLFKQPQARALMKGRGWKPVALAWWDDGVDQGVARRTFDAFDIRAQFFFDPLDGIEPEGEVLIPFCTSDQLRFFDAHDDRAIPLTDVPVVVFSEAMRDVDLFTAVASIGTDPAWQDGGEGRRFAQYWGDMNFGPLSETALLRREVVAHLAAELPIAAQVSIEDRFLVVCGTRATYRIHFGSGSVLVAPGDRHLPITAPRDPRGDQVFLPFDDDRTLREILTLAYVLAGDAAITDPQLIAVIEGG